MRGKKELMAKAIRHAGLLPAVRYLCNGAPQELRILAYHRVTTVIDEPSFPYDPELISASPLSFQEQMAYVARYFEPVRCSEVVSALDGGTPLPARAILITFDDGHADNYTNAFPILRRIGIPATIFLSTAYIGTRDTFWFDRVSYAIFRFPEGRLDLPGLSTPLNLSDVPSRRVAADIVREYLKGLPDTNRQELVDWILERQTRMGLVDDAHLSGALSWDQVKEMAEAGIEFGSHTVSHPILTRLDDFALEKEVVDSRQIIASMIGRPVEVIAYPEGGREAFDSRVISAVKKSGYKLALTYISGRNFLDRFDRFAAYRLHVERYMSLARFQAMLELPGLFGTD